MHDMIGLSHSLNRRMGRRKFLLVLGGAAGSAAVLAAPTGWERFIGSAPVEALESTSFPVSEALARKVLEAARSQGAEFAEMFLSRRTITRLGMSDSQIESVERGIFAGCGVRAVDGEKTGYAYADSFDEGPLMEAADNAAAIASGRGSRSSSVSFTPSSPTQTVVCELPLDEVPENERAGWLFRADEAARGYDSAVSQVSIEHSDEMNQFAVINTDGLWVEDTLPLLYMRLNVNARKNGRPGTGMSRLSFRQGAEQMRHDAAGESAREAARQAVVMCEAGEAPTGEMPVVLSAGGGVLFHEAVGHGLEGDFVRRGTSFYGGRVGEMVASEKVTVIDTGAMADLRGSYNIDDEGTTPQRNVLIEKGILRGFLNDRITAKKLKARPTGNGRRQSYRYPPLVRMSNTFLTTGSDAEEEMIRGIKSGLYASQLGGGEVDITSGNFTFGLREAYRIEDGRIGRPVRGAVLVGNGPEIMQRIDRVGPELKFWAGTCGKGQWVPVSSGAPTLRITAMTVGGSQ